MDAQAEERHWMPEIIKRYWIILLIIAIGITLWLKWPKSDSSVPDVSGYVEKIDSLQSQIDSISTLRDSIDQRIDTVTITIEKTRIQYEKDRNTILNNTISEDYLFFLNYIRDNRARLDSINNL